MTEQLPETRVQVAELKVPEALLLKVIVPVGVMVAPLEVSVTVAVQVLGALTTSGEEQLTLVVVERLLTVKLILPELVRWLVSPP